MMRTSCFTTIDLRCAARCSSSLAVAANPITACSEVELEHPREHISIALTFPVTSRNGMPTFLGSPDARYGRQVNGMGGGESSPVCLRSASLVRHLKCRRLPGYMSSVHVRAGRDRGQRRPLLGQLRKPVDHDWHCRRGRGSLRTADFLGTPDDGRRTHVQLEYEQAHRQYVPYR
ncbi:hypothetical protein BC827DRAFT_103160 [Russula dissimulans]|nr:hypothetical protein BC827DRAFT_103160 [Russula dissimulans]